MIDRTYIYHAKRDVDNFVSKSRYSVEADIEILKIKTYLAVAEAINNLAEKTGGDDG